MLKVCEKPQSRSAVLNSIGYSNHTDNYKKYLKPLLEESLIELTIPDTPRSSNQKYKTTNKGILFFKKL